MDGSREPSDGSASWLLVRRVKKDLRPFSVALCTATFNRLWQLKRALPLTLMHCYPFREKRPGWKMLRASALNILEYH